MRTHMVFQPSEGFHSILTLSLCTCNWHCVCVTHTDFKDEGMHARFRNNLEMGWMCSWIPMEGCGHDVIIEGVTEIEGMSMPCTPLWPNYHCLSMSHYYYF